MDSTIARDIKPIPTNKSAISSGLFKWDVATIKPSAMMRILIIIPGNFFIVSLLINGDKVTSNSNWK